MMPCERVWSRFEAKMKDGTLLKLRTQDLPRSRIDDAVEIIMTHFFAEEVMHKALGVSKDAESYALYKNTMLEFAAKPLSSIIICCADEDEVKEIMGVSLFITTDFEIAFEKNVEDHGTPLLKRMMVVFNDFIENFNPMTEYDSSKSYDHRGMCVVPEYRGLGIATQFLEVRKLLCKAHGIPMVGAWMTAYGSQTAAARSGWKTVKELSFDHLEKKYGVTFVGAPPTLKYMIADPMMPGERVWSRFEAKTKDGTLLKLRTQDLPRSRIFDAVEIIMTHFFAEEVMHKALGVSKDAESYALYKNTMLEFAAKPLSSIIICCADEDEVKEIMGVSLFITTDFELAFEKKVEDHGTPLLKRMMVVFNDCIEYFDPMTEYGSSKLYDHRGMCVVPEYRGLGIATQFLEVRKLLCKAHGIPMVGAWMSAYGSQTAAARSGWKTIKELSLDHLEKKHGVTFVGAPPIMKYMIADVRFCCFISGVSNDAESYAIYKKIVLEFAAKPSSSIIICCADEDEVKEIMGVSFMIIVSDSVNEFKETVKKNGTPLLKKLTSIFEERQEYFDPAKEYGLKKFYDDICACVVPEFRGLGITSQFIKARLLTSKAHGIPMAGAWMTAYGTQIVGARDGLKTVKELSFDYFAKKHGLTFIDAPPTMKYMIPDLEYLTSKSKL